MYCAAMLFQATATSTDGILTVKTASATVPMMKPSELLNFNIIGGFSPCCVNDANHFGRAMIPEAGFQDTYLIAERALLAVAVMIEQTMTASTRNPPRQVSPVRGHRPSVGPTFPTRLLNHHLVGLRIESGFMEMR